MKMAATSLKMKLQRLVDSYSKEIMQVKQFADYSNESLLERMRKHRAKLTVEEKKMLVECFSKVPDKKHSTSEAPDYLTTVIKFLEGLLSYKEYQKLLYDMSLSFIIAHFESFIKDYLNTIYMARIHFLKSEKQLSYEEILKHSSLKKLRQEIVQKEVNKILNQGIDELKTYLKKQFKIDVGNFESWPELREASLRRNLIIHNKGLTDSTYCNKVRFPHKNIKLDTDAKYVSNATTVISNFFQFLNLHFLRNLEL